MNFISNKDPHSITSYHYINMSLSTYIHTYIVLIILRLKSLVFPRIPELNVSQSQLSCQKSQTIVICLFPNYHCKISIVGRSITLKCRITRLKHTIIPKELTHFIIRANKNEQLSCQHFQKGTVDQIKLPCTILKNIYQTTDIIVGR